MMATLNIKCENCYIAYINILGYKEYCEEEPELAIRIGDFLEKKIDWLRERLPDMGEYSARDISKTLDIRFICFGESIALIMSVGTGSMEIYRVLGFLSIVSDIQYDLMLEERILVRGTVLSAPIRLDEHCIQGPGLAYAMKMIRQVSGPRIVVERNLMMYVYNSNLLGESGLSWVWNKLMAMRGITDRGEYVV